MPHTFIIAEAGSNHAGSIDIAVQLIHTAKWAGADACKFQFCLNYSRLLSRRKIGECYPFSIKKDWLAPLKELCDKTGIEFMCTAYLPEDIEVIAPYVERFKISAFESKDDEFYNAHLLYHKPILASGRQLYCVSKYPCLDHELNLINLAGFVGLSDHTRNPLTGALAVAMGAQYIETHFRSSSTPRECPDFEVSRNSSELLKYIFNIRQAEILVGECRQTSNFAARAEAR